MGDKTVLCASSPSNDGDEITVERVREWLADLPNCKSKLAGFYKDRMRERYIAPIEALDKDDKNGFSIMALACLMIESHVSHMKGWKTSSGRSETAFCYFFDKTPDFDSFRGYFSDFYDHVRCGILHQGETTGGWTISRKKTVALFEKGDLRVNATKFHKAVGEAIESYSSQLEKLDLESQAWTNFREKIKSVLKNCERKK